MTAQKPPRKTPRTPRDDARDIPINRLIRNRKAAKRKRPVVQRGLGRQLVGVPGYERFDEVDGADID